MPDSAEKIPAAIFKAECLKLMDQVARTREPVVITKHGRPVAQLAPLPTVRESLFGYMRESMQTAGDVTAPLDVEWHAQSRVAEPNPSPSPVGKRTLRRRR